MSPMRDALDHDLRAARFRLRLAKHHGDETLIEFWASRVDELLDDVLAESLAQGDAK